METETSKESQSNPYEVEELEIEKYGTDKNYKHKYIWQLVTAHTALQLAGLVGMYSTFAYAKRASILWGKWSFGWQWNEEDLSLAWV